MKNLASKISLICYKPMHSLFVLLIEAAVFLCGWYFSVPWVNAAMCLAASLAILVVGDDETLFGPLILFALISFNGFVFYDTVGPEIFTMVGSLLVGMVLLLGKRAWLGKKIHLGFGSMGLSLSFLVGVLFLSSLVNQFAQSFDPSYVFYGWMSDLIGLAFLLIYFVLRLGADERQEDFIKEQFYVYNLILLSEITVVFFRTNDHQAIWMDLGWGTKNIVSLALEISLPFLADIFADDYRRDDILIILGLDTLFIFLSGSRGGIVTYLALTPLLAYILVSKKSKLLWHDVLLSVSIIYLILLFMLQFFPPLHDSFVRLLAMGDDISGREQIWNDALGYFKRDPLVGSSLAGLIDLFAVWSPSSTVIGIWFCHSTFFTLAACGGLLGLIGYFYHMFEISWSLLKSQDKIKASLFYLFLVGLIHGLIDNTFFNIAYMFPYVLVLSSPSLLSFFPKEGRKLKELRK